MIPIKLTIEGLYSYREAQTIDFANLTSSGLFGIFGGVGSGKSSILEAISFTLFGESERLNARDSRSYNMMNLKSNELLIDFVFKTHGGEFYRLITRGKRNKKKFDDVKTFERTAYHLESDEWVPIPVEDIETITGLNYKNFRRTIIIPQGKFQEFLQLSPTDRTTMLKELFNLGKYELSDKISRLDNKNEARLNNLTGRLTEIGEVDPEMIETQTALRKNLIAESDTFIQTLASREKTEREAEELKNLAEKIHGFQNKLAEMMKTEPEINERERLLVQFERFSRIFKTDFQRAEELRIKLAGSETQLNGSRKSLEKIQDEAGTMRHQLERMKQEYDNRDALLRESEEIRKFSEILSAKNDQSALEQKSEVFRVNLKEISEQIQTLKTQAESATAKVEAMRRNLPDMMALAAVKNWFLERARLSKAGTEIRNKIAEATGQLMAVGDALKKELTKAEWLDISTEKPDISAVTAAIEKIKTTSELTLKELSVNISELEVQKRLENFAAALHDGKPCPLCGSPDHPHILNPTGVDRGLVELQERSGKLTTIIKICMALEKMMATAVAKEDSIKQQILGFETELNELDQLLKQHIKGFTWTDFDPVKPQQVVDTENQYNTAIKSISETEILVKKSTNELTTKGLSLEKQTKELAEIDSKANAFRAKIELLQSQITRLDTESLGSFSFDQLTERADLLTVRYKTLTTSYENLTSQLQEIEKKISGESGKISEIAENHRKLKEEADLLARVIEEKQNANGNPDREMITAILGNAVDVERERGEIERFRREVGSLQKFIEELRKQLNERIYDEVAHGLLKSEIAELKTGIASMEREIVRLEIGIKMLETKAKDYAAVRDDFHKAESRKQDINELKNLFRSSGFVNYVSTVYLQNLCKSANDRFYRLTRQKLGLELADDNSFLVRDYMNDGHVRNVKTLSGGQTFQASLSLALALADSIQKLAGSQENFFFLDEGFGTLDKETLDIAFETLKSLRKENRIVGVISHVEEMQAEIETFIRVTNDETRGSIVKASWENFT